MRERTALWDKRSGLYSLRKTEKDEIWEQVAAVAGMPGMWITLYEKELGTLLIFVRCCARVTGGPVVRLHLCFPHLSVANSTRCPLI